MSKVILDKAVWLNKLKKSELTHHEIDIDSCEKIAPFVKGFMSTPVAELTDDPQGMVLLARSVRTTIPQFIDALTAEDGPSKIHGDVYLYMVLKPVLHDRVFFKDEVTIRFAVHRDGV